MLQEDWEREKGHLQRVVAKAENERMTREFKEKLEAIMALQEQEMGGVDRETYEKYTKGEIVQALSDQVRKSNMDDVISYLEKASIHLAMQVGVSGSPTPTGEAWGNEIVDCILVQMERISTVTARLTEMGRVCGQIRRELGFDDPEMKRG